MADIPKIMADIFYFVEKPHNQRNNSTIQRKANRGVCFGTESISSLAPNLWELKNIIKNYAKSKTQNR